MSLVYVSQPDNTSLVFVLKNIYLSVFVAAILGRLIQTELTKFLIYNLKVGKVCVCACACLYFEVQVVKIMCPGGDFIIFLTYPVMKKGLFHKNILIL